MSDARLLSDKELAAIEYQAVTKCDGVSPATSGKLFAHIAAQADRIRELKQEVATLNRHYAEDWQNIEDAISEAGIALHDSHGDYKGLESCVKELAERLAAAEQETNEADELLRKLTDELVEARAAEQVAADIETLLDRHYGVAIEPRDGMRRVRPYGYGVMSCEEPTLSAALRAAAAKLETQTGEKP